MPIGIEHTTAKEGRIVESHHQTQPRRNTVQAGRTRGGKVEATSTFRSTPPLVKAKPMVFITNSDKAIEEHRRLTKTLEVIRPGHGEPSVDEMISGLRLISAEFAKFNWKLTPCNGLHHITFPSQEGLTHEALEHRSHAGITLSDL